MQITRIKPGGWIIILLVLAALFFGVRSCRNLVAPHQAATNTGGSDTASSNTGTSNTDTSNGSGSNGGTLSRQQTANGDVIVSTTGTKQAWLKTEVDAFNSQSQTGKVTLQIAESRDAMHGILDGKQQPTLWSPSSPVWVYRLAEIWPSAHGGAQILDTGNSQTYRALFKSPLVFLTTKAKAGFLRPLLTGATPWESVRQLSLGQRKTPWGSFHFAYADPLNASSGTLTMSLIITEYDRTHNVSDPTVAAKSPAFAAYLSQINRAYVRDPSATGSSALEKAYTADPSSRDFITAYESAALAAVERDPNFVMIYPSPTANADQTIYQLMAPWVTDSQKATASAFLDFLAKPEAIDDGVQYYFRPAQNGAQTLSARLGPAAKSQYQFAYTSIDLPPYDALNDAAAQWRTQMKQ